MKCFWKTGEHIASWISEMTILEYEANEPPDEVRKKPAAAMKRPAAALKRPAQASNKKSGPANSQARALQDLPPNT